MTGVTDLMVTVTACLVIAIGVLTGVWLFVRPVPGDRGGATGDWLRAGMLDWMLATRTNGPRPVEVIDWTVVDGPDPRVTVIARTGTGVILTAEWHGTFDRFIRMLEKRSRR